ncbi:MAG: hypothetical protein GY708_18005 [Actinomycetia bacterium]|nr:hypothetical protein [Actinomycetes bacterium]MCP4961896.1 hypothetical protein [Actinomycetes bacterium]
MASEPGFLEELILDPDAVVKPLISQIAGDDGDVDVSELSIAVHVQTPKTAHFVIDVNLWGSETRA